MCIRPVPTPRSARRNRSAHSPLKRALGGARMDGGCRPGVVREATRSPRSLAPTTAVAAMAPEVLLGWRGSCSPAAPTMGSTALSRIVQVCSTDYLAIESISAIYKHKHAVYARLLRSRSSDPAILAGATPLSVSHASDVSPGWRRYGCRRTTGWSEGGNEMQTSAARILTTHTGSLPRPAGVALPGTDPGLARHPRGRRRREPRPSPTSSTARWTPGSTW